MALRMPIMVELHRIPQDETLNYIVHRLVESNHPEDLFDAEAASLIGTASGGIPAKVNAIARRSLAAAWMAGSHTVGVAEVSSVVSHSGNAEDNHA